MKEKILEFSDLNSEQMQSLTQSQNNQFISSGEGDAFNNSLESKTKLNRVQTVFSKQNNKKL